MDTRRVDLLTSCKLLLGRDCLVYTYKLSLYCKFVVWLPMVGDRMVLYMEELPRTLTMLPSSSYTPTPLASFLPP